MSFHNLFLQYKLNLREIKKESKRLASQSSNDLSFWNQLLNQLLLYIAPIGFLSTLIFFLTVGVYYAFAPFTISIFVVIIITIADSKAETIKQKLKSQCIPIAELRMSKMECLLNSYNIKFTNITTLDWLIEEARYAQVKYDYLAQFKKYFQHLKSVLLVVIGFMTAVFVEISRQTQIFSKTSPAEIAFLSLQIILLIVACWGFYISASNILKDLFYLEYNKYEEFIYDIRQVKLFYSNNPTNYGELITSAYK